MKSYGFSFPYKSNNERESFSDYTNIYEAWSINSLKKAVYCLHVCFYNDLMMSIKYSYYLIKEHDVTIC